MASLLSHAEWVAEAQSIYDDAEKSGGVYTRLSTTRRKVERLMADAGVEDPAATAAEVVTHVNEGDGVDN